MSPSDKGRSSLHANYSVRTGYTRQFLSYFHECSFILGFCIFPKKKTIPNRRLLVLRRVPESTSLLLTSVSRSTPTFGGAVQSPCGPRFHTKTSPLIKDSHPPPLFFPSVEARARHGTSTCVPGLRSRTMSSMWF